MASVSLQEGRIQFRHPIVRDDDGHGIVVKKRIGKLPLLEQEQARIDLEKLVEKKPRLRSEVADTDDIGDLAKDIYFEPMAQMTADTETLERFAKLTVKQQAKGEQILRFLRSKGREKEPTLPVELIEDFIDDMLDQQVELSSGLNSALKTIEGKDNIIEGLEKATGAQRAEQKALTLEECFEHFKAHVSCKSANAKSKLLRRVQMVIDAIGLKTKHSAVTKKAIEDGIKNSKPRSETEGLYRARDIRRFFRLLSWQKNSDGLGLGNPADSFKSGSQSSLQRKRRQAGQIEILDPATLLKNAPLSEYWKALIALIGYGGLRLAEAAALEWDRIDFKTKIIKVRPTASYPQLKSFMSARDVKPFGNVWKFLTEYKKVARHEPLTFDREGPAGPTWFRLQWFPIGEAAALSRVFSPALKQLQHEFEKVEAIDRKTKHGVLTIKECNFEDIAYRLTQTKSKIVLDKGEPTASDLSSALIDAIGEATGMPCKLKDGKIIAIRTIHLQHGEYRFRLSDDSVLKIARAEVESIERPKEPARRLRRFWETTMRANGLGDLIQAMGGHSNAVGLAHYTKFEKIVADAKIPKLATRKS